MLTEKPLLILDSLPTTISTDIDYSTEPGRTDDLNTRRLEEQIDLRSNQETERPVELPETPNETENKLEESQERRIELPSRPEETKERPEEFTERPEESDNKSEEGTERIETPTEESENLTERPEEHTDQSEKHTETPEEHTEMPEHTENHIERTEIPEQSRNINMVEKKFEIKSTTRFNETDEYDEVTFKRPKISILPPPVEEFTSEPSYEYSTIKPLINNTSQYRIPPNKTSVVKNQEVTKESKIYLGNSFEEISGKFNTNLILV